MKMHDRENMSRRMLVAGLAATAVLPFGARAQQQSSFKLGQVPDAPIEVAALNSITVKVSNLKRSLEFYQGLFGMPIQTWQGMEPCLRVGDGPSFIKLKEVPGFTARTPDPGEQTPSAGGYESICLGIKNFNPERVRQILADHKIAAELKRRGDTPELYFHLSDGLGFQLQSEVYAGGGGPNGDRIAMPPIPPKLLAAQFHVRSFNHVTIQVADALRTVNELQSITRMPVVAVQHDIPTLGIASSPILGIVGGYAHTGANHLCFGIKYFEVGEVVQKCVDFGLEPVSAANNRGLPIKPMSIYVEWRQPFDLGGGRSAPLGTPSIMLRDPDGNLLQIQDVSYCAGSGPLGDKECEVKQPA